MPARGGVVTDNVFAFRSDRWAEGVIGLTLNGKSFPATAPVIAKQGEYGAALYSEHGFFALPAYPLEDVVDPTGAEAWTELVEANGFDYGGAPELVRQLKISTITTTLAVPANAATPDSRSAEIQSCPTTAPPRAGLFFGRLSL